MLRCLTILWAAALLLVAAGCAGRQAAEEFGDREFEVLMQKLARGWNEGNARLAADCFTPDAVYTEPPDKQLYRGREALYKFFGGSAGRKAQMKMTWHHLIFNDKTRIGAGEFTFEYGSKVHGVAVVKIKNGRISNWREYWYESTLDWQKFTENNPF